MLAFTVTDERCIRCGACVRDCPARIIERAGQAVPVIAAEREEACLRCQHCLAVCPTGALSILGKNPEDSLPVDRAAWPTPDALSNLIRGRRSVRQYEDRDVEPALLQSLLATVAHAPTGVNSRQLTLTVLDDRAVMARFQKQVMAGLKAAAADGRIPERFLYLQKVISWPYSFGLKLLFRAAPHALIVSAPPTAPCPDQDIAIALATFDLLAQSAGLGTVWWGMLHMVLVVLPELKAELGLSADHHFYAMLFGYPAVQYARTVQRDDAATVQRVEL